MFCRQLLMQVYIQVIEHGPRWQLAKTRFCALPKTPLLAKTNTLRQTTAQVFNTLSAKRLRLPKSGALGHINKISQSIVHFAGVSKK